MSISGAPDPPDPPSSSSTPHFVDCASGSHLGSLSPVHLAVPNLEVAGVPADPAKGTAGDICYAMGSSILAFGSRSAAA